MPPKLLLAPTDFQTLRHSCTSSYFDTQFFHTNDSINVNKEKISLRHPLPTFVIFSFFQASIWLRVDKVLQKITKSYKNELRHLFQCSILILRKRPRKTPFQNTVPPPSRFHRSWFEILPLKLAPSNDINQKCEPFHSHDTYQCSLQEVLKSWSNDNITDLPTLLHIATRHMWAM